jgi:hypothetical protein
MAKTKDNPVETMQLDIEFADNGIILRNPDCIDEVTLALTLESVDGEGKKRLVRKRVPRHRQEDLRLDDRCGGA